MAKSTKVISTSAPTFVTGGKGKMFGQQGATPAKPGSASNKGAGGTGGGKFAAGGNGHMFGKQSVKPSKKK